MAFQLKLLCCAICLLAVQELPGAAGISTICDNTGYKETAQHGGKLAANDGKCSMICKNQLDEFVQSFKAMLKEERKAFLHNINAMLKQELTSARLVGDSSSVRRPGDWIVIQRRNSGQVNFYREWNEYKKGFGSPSGEFWLGNDKIHDITSKGRYMLRIVLEYRGKRSYADYASFSIDNEANKYKLHIGKYSGTAGDSLTAHNNMKFTTYDQDNDLYHKVNCARFCKGAWWYDKCQYSNLNGDYGSKKLRQALDWVTLAWRNGVSFSEMKIRQIL